MTSADARGREVLAGVAVAIVSLPFCIGFGLMAFEPLGPGQGALGPRAGLIGGAVLAIVAGFLGGTRSQASAPIVAGAIVLNEVLRSLSADARLPQDPDLRLEILVGLAGLTVAAAGLFQVAFGALRLGTLVKYLAYPVVAGLMAGVGVLTLLGQLGAFLGPSGLSAPEASPLVLATFALGVATILVNVVGSRRSRQIPGPLIALGAGIVLGQIVILGLGLPIPVVQGVAPSFPRPFDPTAAGRFLYEAGSSFTVTALLGPALSIALFSSLNSLLASCAVDELSGAQHDANRELVGQGAGNLAAALFAGLPGGGLMSLSTLNYRSGGRSAVAAVGQGLTLLAFLLLLGPLMPLIPRVVLAAIIVVVAVSMFDPWIVRLGRSLLDPARRLERADLLADLGLVALVAVVAVAWGLATATILGMAVSCLQFFARMGKVRFRMAYRGDAVHSRRARPLGDLEQLAAAGRAIAVFELQGPLFFGSAARLVSRIQDESAGASYVIVGLSRVEEIDASGFRVLYRFLLRLRNEDRQVLVAHLTACHPFWPRLRDMGVAEADVSQQFFPDTDSALQWAEDHLLAATRPPVEGGTEVPLTAIDVLRGLPPGLVAWLEQNTTREVYAPGAVIVQEGDTDRAAFFLTAGLVSVVAEGKSGQAHGGPARLASCTAGTVFGEVALLDAGGRSASVFADGEVVCRRLSAEALERLGRDEPGLALALVQSLANALAQRLRASSAEVLALRD